MLAQLHRLHVHLHDRTHFNGTAAVENRTPTRQLHGLIDVACLDERKAADKILRFGERTIGDGLLLATHHLARPLQRLPAVLQMALLVEIVHPGHPTLHVLLCAFGAAHRILPRSFRHSVEIEKLAHVAAPFGAFMTIPSSSTYMTFQPATAGQETASEIQSSEKNFI